MRSKAQKIVVSATVSTHPPPRGHLSGQLGPVFHPHMPYTERETCSRFDPHPKQKFIEIIRSYLWDLIDLLDSTLTHSPLSNLLLV